MSDALQLVEQIRSDLRPLETKISGHPYLRALEEGQVQRDVLKVFAGQQHHIIRSDLRSIALILSRQGMLPSLHFLMNVLQGEAAALDALHPFTRALGLTTGDLEMFEPLPAAHAYCTFVAWLALYGSDFLSCWCGLPKIRKDLAACENGRRIVRARRKPLTHYCLSRYSPGTSSSGTSCVRTSFPSAFPASSTPVTTSASNAFPSSSNSPTLSESAPSTLDNPCKSPDCRPERAPGPSGENATVSTLWLFSRTCFLSALAVFAPIVF
jgi:hypothetical protein